MERSIIIGNSGSGKTHLARRLGSRFGYPLIHLDRLFWEPGGFTRKRPIDVVQADIALLAQQPTWVVEGVFGELDSASVPPRSTWCGSIWIGRRASGV